MAPHKILLADALLDIPVFDVSPGEMYFASLARDLSARGRACPAATPAEYGARLAGVIVKYEAEAARARRHAGRARARDPERRRAARRARARRARPAAIGRW